MRNFFSKSLYLLVFCVVTIHLQAQAPDQRTDVRLITVGGRKFRDFNKNGRLDVYEDYRRPIVQRVQDLLSQMSMEEKLAQLQSPWFGKSRLFSDNAFDWSKAANAFPHGLGEILQISHGNYVFAAQRAPNPSQIAVLANQIQRYFINGTRLGVPVLYLEEALHGLMIRDGTMFPSALGMASSWNEELTHEVFEAVAQEARAVGAHAVLAPVLDLALDPRWGRTEETMGEDPYLVSRLGVAKVKGLQGGLPTPDSNHVAATLKHFGAHGMPEGGSNAGPVFVSERWLREVNFKPFRAAIVEGKAMGVMPNYNEISGVPTHANRWMLTGVLRREWGFQGLVISDLMAVNQLNTEHHIARDASEAGALAIKAGVDIELTGNEASVSHLPEAIVSGYASPTDVDSAVWHVLEVKFRLGLFDRPFIDTSRTNIVASPEHSALALKAARQSIVLLKNDGGVLPFDRAKFKKIAVIGPNSDQCILGGYSHIPRSTITPLAAIRERYKDVQIIYAEGCKLTQSGASFGPVKLTPHEENAKLIREAVAASRDADAVVLMLGGNDRISREATTPTSPGDLATLELLGDQNELVDSIMALKKPTAAFVFSGPPISFVHLSKTVPAIVQCWYLGQETGYAVAETLFGDNNPSGKLPMSIPRSVGHLPDYYFAKPTARERPYHLDSITPLYPFGFGLSYTNYQYASLRIDKQRIGKKDSATVTIDVTNTGSRAGEEIIELYIRDEVSSVTRPIMELKDFARVALKPGESKAVSFIVSPDKLRFYDLKMKEVVEPGDFTIMVGSSSQQVQSLKLTVF